ncbi:MAG: RadC family protein [Oceanidesulfovibrio sp.]
MADKPHYHGHRQRLKERLCQDPTRLADYEILELLLAFTIPRRDTKPMAKELIDRCGSLRGVMLARPEELSEVKGLGPSAETFFTLFKEVRARVEEDTARSREILSHPANAARMAMCRLGHLSVEEFWMALVDTKNRLIGWERVTTGTVNETAVYPRELIAKALGRKAASFIIVHNHPGGDPKPSGMDDLLTERVKRACDEVGIRLLDHIIVTEDDYYSYQMQGAL